ncbi:hypothetical protein ACP70R_030821 [Stipagrostis hirtigluma subsp. patula]
MVETRLCATVEAIRRRRRAPRLYGAISPPSIELLHRVAAGQVPPPSPPNPSPRQPRCRAGSSLRR